MPKKLYIKTHGCQMNEYDSEKMSKLLVDKKNFEITSSEQDADLIILNTCSIREKSARESFPSNRQMEENQREKPNLKSLLEDVLLHKKEKKLLKERQKLT